MTSENKLIDRETISELLYGEEKYIQEFADATIDSYREFLDKYREHVLDHDLKELREAGHKIKPISQMLNLSVIIEEYEHVKQLLDQSEPSQDKLQASIERMDEIVQKIIRELKEI